MQSQLTEKQHVAKANNDRPRPLSRSFHIVAWLEGVSYLLILFVTMPLKYMMDIPEANKVVGMAHGVLFVAYVALALEQMFSNDYSKRWGFYALIASVIPFGAFVFAARHQKAAQAQTPE